jgi:hypothetical protein
MAAKHSITRADIMPLDAYLMERGDRRRRIAELKRRRRIEVGPFATFYFENYETMWHQVHEMLAIEKGGEAQIADELDAYNPLIPKGAELVATVMLEIDDERRRPLELAKLGGIENHIFLRIDGVDVRGLPEGGRENTRAEDNKASSVQFAHFRFAPGQIAAFRKPGAKILLGFDHPSYGHIAILPEDVRTTLADDFD